LLEIFPENEQEKVTCPPLLKERGLGGGEAVRVVRGLFDKLQFIFTTLKKCLIFLCISRATNEKNAANAPCCKIK
jgi:hypothetical protein